MALLGLWFIFYKLLRYVPFIQEFYSVATSVLTDCLLHVSAFFLKLANFDAIVNTTAKTISISDKAFVHLDKGCLGRNLMGLFAGFILAFPGSNRFKLYIIPSGLLFIYFLNTLRISILLAIIYLDPSAYRKYNHHDIFAYVVYFFIFLFWVLYIRLNEKKVAKQPVSLIHQEEKT